MRRDGLDLRYLVKNMIRLWGRSPIQTLWGTRKLQVGLIRSGLARRWSFKKENLLVPMGIGISPTFRCNLSCRGCYARFHPKDDEMPFPVIQRVIRSAVNEGVFLFVVTGGEPYLRPEMMKLYEEYCSTLFWTVTNGTLIDETLARRIARCGNVFPVVSIEGGERETDRRRGEGVYRKVTGCMELLHAAGVHFGFSSVLTADTIDLLGSRDFVSSMVDRGCTLGVFNEFIPLSPDDKDDLPGEQQKKQFRERLSELRKRERIILIHLPYDEYDEDGRCMAVAGGGLHINALGWVEPCPFAHYARENVKDLSFREVLESPFLEAIRAHPTVLQHGEVGCSLVNNRATFEKIAMSGGAKSTNMNPNCSLGGSIVRGDF